MKGINPKYLDKLDEAQRKFALTGPGKMFLDDFVFLRGNHCVVPGTTGAGKTNRGYWLLSWLKFTETQIWMDTGKSDEILPLLCQGLPVQIIIPKYCDVIIEERKNGKWQRIENHPDVVYVPDAGDAWWTIRKKTINILCFRNAFWTASARARWMTEFFETLAMWSRLKRMPAIFPFSLHMDETQWAVSGVRVTRDEERTKSSEIITENVLEIRSAGGRIIAYIQDFINIPPAIRQNLVCALLCRGAEIKSEHSKKLARHCFPPPWEKAPTNFRKNESKFVTEDGRSSPTNVPWRIPLFPKDKEDREWCSRCRVRYVGFNDQKPEESEMQEECFPELGRFQAMAIPPEKIEGLKMTRWDGYPGVVEDDG